MEVLQILIEAVRGSGQTVFGIAVIVFPLMIALEAAKDLNILDWLTKLISPISRLFKIPDEAGLPILAGLIFGIAYGAGAIIQSAKEGKMSQRDLIIVNTFLVICHAIFEDTMLFVAIGAKGWIILLFRLAMAVIVTFVMARYTYKKSMKRSLASGVIDVKR